MSVVIGNNDFWQLPDSGSSGRLADLIRELARQPGRGNYLVTTNFLVKFILRMDAVFVAILPLRCIRGWGSLSVD